jgi:hypothetical protein
VLVLGPAVAVAGPSLGEVAEEQARTLYQEAEGLAKAGEWGPAADKYEEAYHLVPSKHGFAFKVGQAAWKAGDCSRADKYLAHFRTYGDMKKHAEYMGEADRILNEIEFKGCAVQPAETDASKRGCSVSGEETGLALAFSLAMLAAVPYRRSMGT